MIEDRLQTYHRGIERSATESRLLTFRALEKAVNDVPAATAGRRSLKGVYRRRLKSYRVCKRSSRLATFRSHQGIAREHAFERLSSPGWPWVSQLSADSP